MEYWTQMLITHYIEKKYLNIEYLIDIFFHDEGIFPNVAIKLINSNCLIISEPNNFRV